MKLYWDLRAWRLYTLLWPGAYNPVAPLGFASWQSNPLVFFPGMEHLAKVNLLCEVVHGGDSEAAWPREFDSFRHIWGLWCTWDAANKEEGRTWMDTNNSSFMLYLTGFWVFFYARYLFSGLTFDLGQVVRWKDAWPMLSESSGNLQVVTCWESSWRPNLSLTLLWYSLEFHRTTFQSGF